MTQTFKTDHPTIKEITIGDRFVVYKSTNKKFIETMELIDSIEGEKFVFSLLYKNGINVQIIFLNKDLTPCFDRDKYIIVSHKIPSFEDKLNLL